MTYNFFKFSTLTVTAALGLGLMVSGCSDGGGKTTVYPFNPAPVPTPTPSPSPSPVAETGSLKLEFDVLLDKAVVPVMVKRYHFAILDAEGAPAEYNVTVDGTEYPAAGFDVDKASEVVIDGIEAGEGTVEIGFADEEGNIIAKDVETFTVEADTEATAETAYHEAAGIIAEANGHEDAIELAVGEEATATFYVYYKDLDSEQYKEELTEAPYVDVSGTYQPDFYDNTIIELPDSGVVKGKAVGETKLLLIYATDDYDENKSPAENYEAGAVICSNNNDETLAEINPWLQITVTGDEGGDESGDEGGDQGGDEGGDQGGDEGGDEGGEG